MEARVFYPQNGSLYYDRRSSNIYRVIRTVSMFEGATKRITLFERREERGEAAWWLPTDEFGERFAYIPNWIEYSDSDVIPAPR